MLCATEAPGTFSAETNSASYSLPAADSPLGVLGPQWIRRDGCVSAADLSQRGGRVSPFLRRGDAQAPKYFCWLPAGSKNFRRGGCPGFKIFPMGLSGLRENLEERRIFPRSSGCEGSIFAAELPAPSKLQGCASFDISAARSRRTSKDQGAGQASRYFARETEVVESLELSGLRNVCWAARVVSGRGKNCPPSHSANEPGS